MLGLLLFAQVAVSAPDTATYSSQALRSLVAEAARLNRDIPPALGSYRAKVESEISMGIRDGSGRESAVSVEQIAGEMTFDRSGAFEQHVTGYRTPLIGFAAVVGFFRSSWVTPVLYGNRIVFSLLNAPPPKPATPGDSALAARRPARPVAKRDDTPPLHVVHPLADDRERYYRFFGGDTVQVVNVENRTIPIVRVDVRPRDSLPARSVVFGGEIDLDITRHHIIRLRGAFYTVAAKAPKSGGLVRNPGASVIAGIEALEYVELVNGEVDQKYWLPQYQRSELQIAAPVFGEGKYVYRIVSRMRDFSVTPPDATQTAERADTAGVRHHVLTFATRDSLGAYRDWQARIGAATSSVSADDLLDVGPTRWRSDGPPVITVQGEHASDLVHFNRVEGWFTGIGANARLRDAAPGVTLRAALGYGWSERTLRGRASAELRRGPWTYGLRGGRSLDITNDFRNSLDSGNTIGALFGVDEYDYVDRYSAGIAVARSIGHRAARVRVELGWADDRATTSHRTTGMFGDDVFPPNRGIDPGSYLRTAATLEWHTNALTESAWPGVGASLSYLRGDGQIDFQRAELQLTTRRISGQWTYSADVRAGMLFGAPVPQQLFEIAGTEYKEFAGDEAAAVSARATYHFRLFTSPIVALGKHHFIPQVVLPGFAPAVSVRATTAWTGASDAAASAAIARLGTRTTYDPNSITMYAPASTTTRMPQTSVGAALTFFGGMIGIGTSRRIDRDAPWKLTLGFGTAY